MPLNLKYKITEKITTTLNCQLPKFCHSCLVISLDNGSRVPKILSKFKENLNAKIEVGEKKNIVPDAKSIENTFNTHKNERHGAANTNYLQVTGNYRPKSLHTHQFALKSRI